MIHRLVMIIPLCLVCAAFSQETPKPQPAPVRQVWDYADELDLSPQQRTALFAIRDRYEAARAAVRAASGTNLPPDMLRAAQLNLNDQLRLANRQLGELLTDAQKEKLTELREAGTERRTSARRPATATDDGDGAPALTTTRKPPRKQLSEEAYRKLAAELRAMYAQPATNWPAPHLDDDIKPHFQELGLLPPVVFPTNNPYTSAKAELGKKLFFDPRLSGSGQISCASCHDPDLGFADGRTVAFGHERRELKRNAPTILNSAFNTTLFWDGRATSLEKQAADVVNNADEMHSSEHFVYANLNKIPATVTNSPPRLVRRKPRWNAPSRPSPPSSAPSRVAATRLIPSCAATPMLSATRRSAGCTSSAPRRAASIATTVRISPTGNSTTKG